MKERDLTHWWPAKLAIAAFASIVVGCSDSDDATTQLRAIHASSDAPNVDVRINRNAELTDVPYRTASSFLTVPAGTTSLSVEPTGTSSSVINASLALTENLQYTAVVVGRASASASPSASADEQLQAVLVEDPANAPAAGNVKVRVVHGAPGVPAVDIYVTAPGAALSSDPTIAGLAYRGVAPASGTKALEVPAGTYEIRATVTGDQAKAVVFDSGPVPLSANSDVLLTAIPSSGVSPVSLLVSPAAGSASVIADNRAAVRVAHFSPNVPAVDVSLNISGSATSVLSLPNVSFPADSGYTLVPAGTYDASVALASNPSVPVLTLNGASLSRDTSRSVFAIGLLGGTGVQTLQLAAFGDDRVPVADKAKVRVIHLSPDAPAVDVVALGDGGVIAATLVTNLAYPNATAAHLQVAPNTYTLAVVPTGATAPVLPTPAGVTVTLKAGEIATVAAIGCVDTASGPCAQGRPFALKLLSDS